MNNENPGDCPATSVKFYNPGSDHALSAARESYLDTMVPRWCPPVPVPAKLSDALATAQVVPDLNFVFGEASAVSRAAVFSTARLDPRFYGEPEDEAILLRRAATEAVHELGHVFGLGHCTRPRCVMWFSNTRAETDRKGSEFCPRCAGGLGLSPSGR